MNDYTLDGGEWDALQDAMSDEANLGEDFEVACNVTPDEHVHARRAGALASGLGGRVALLAHGSNGHAIVYIAAPQARTFAAHLLNIADELEGVTPLAFLPRFPEEGSPVYEEVYSEDAYEGDDGTVSVEPATPSLPGLLVDLALFPLRLLRGRE